MKYLQFIAMLLMLCAALAFGGCDDEGGSDGGDGTTGATVINIASIPGVTPPNYDETPVTAITETAQYTGTVSWSPADAAFAATTVYTATITLTAKSGYTLTGVAADFFTVAGATSTTNSADTGILTAVFPATGAPSAGDTETYTADGVSFVMAYVPGGLTFPTGINDDGTATVANAYWIGETEVTYELWDTVYTWATSGTGSTGSGQYTFANAGSRGGYFDGSSWGVYVSGHETHPVTTVSWRDSMVWCNALTEWYNANNGTAADIDCVYYTDSGYVTPIRSANDTESFDETAGSQDNPYVKAAAKGFRLLSSNEWELAARYRGTDTTNVVTGTVLGVDFSAMSIKWTKGNSASAATTYSDDSTGGSGEPGKTANDTVAIYFAYWNGSSMESTGVSSTAEVKSKTTGYNALGLYDMSGNVWEWGFDLSGPDRVEGGGSWDNNAWSLRVGSRSYDFPNVVGLSIGFRFARSAQ